MSTMASQITSITNVYSTVHSRRRSKKISKLRVTGLYGGNSPVTGEFLAQMASNAENVSICDVIMQRLHNRLTKGRCKQYCLIANVHTTYPKCCIFRNRNQKFVEEYGDLITRNIWYGIIINGQQYFKPADKVDGSVTNSENKSGMNKFKHHSNRIYQ